jgi:hypothetical protein
LKDCFPDMSKEPDVVVGHLTDFHTPSYNR